MADIHVTEEMLKDLACDSYHNSNEVNNLKCSKRFLEVVFIRSDLTIEAIETISCKITQLASIEACNNCVPFDIAKQQIKKGIEIFELLTAKDDSSEIFKTRIVAFHWYSLSKIISTLFITLKNKKTEIAIYYDEPRKRLIELLLFQMLKCMDISQDEIPLSRPLPSHSTVLMMVLKSGDMDTAIYNITSSLNNPITSLQVLVVCVEESVLDIFCHKVKEGLKPYASEILRDEYFMDKYKKISNVLEKLKPKIIKPPTTNDKDITPFICHEFDRKYFESEAPIVILKSFRTIKEAINMAKEEESIDILNIWTQDISAAFEIAYNCSYKFNHINCFDMDWIYLAKKLESNQVGVVNSYHVERIISNGIDKYVAFPFGTIFAN